MVVFCGVLMSVTSLLSAYSVKHLPLGIFAIFVQSTVIFTPIIGAFVKRVLPSLWTVTYIVLLVLGDVLVVKPTIFLYVSHANE